MRSDSETQLTKSTSPPLCLDDGLVAGPEEIFLADALYESSPFHHLQRIVVDSRKHKCPILPMQSLMQTMDGFKSSRVNQ